MSVPAPQVNSRAQKVSYSWPGNLTGFSANYYATQTHADSVITLAGDPARPNILRQLMFSYSGGTPAGSIQVEDGSGNIVFSLDIVAGGPKDITFDPPLAGTVNNDMIVTLTDGGSGIIGKLNVNAWTEL